MKLQVYPPAAFHHILCSLDPAQLHYSWERQKQGSDMTTVRVCVSKLTNFHETWLDYYATG